MRQILLYSSSVLPRQALAGELRALNAAEETVEFDVFENAIAALKTDSFSAAIFDEPESEQQIQLESVGAPLFFLMKNPVESDCAAVFQKPFRLSALLTAVIGAAARFEQSALSSVQIGVWSFSLAAKTLTFQDQEIKLTEKEAALVNYLYRKAAPVNRDALLRDIWGYGDGISTHTLETHIYRLRQKLEPAGISFTVGGSDGYKLIY